MCLSSGVFMAYPGPRATGASALDSARTCCVTRGGALWPRRAWIPRRLQHFLGHAIRLRAARWQEPVFGHLFSRGDAERSLQAPDLRTHLDVARLARKYCPVPAAKPAAVCTNSNMLPANGGVVGVLATNGSLFLGCLGRRGYGATLAGYRTSAHLRPLQ